MRKVSTIIRWLLVIIGIYIIFQLLSGFYAVLNNGSLADLVWLFAGDLHQDREQRTNFLLLGMGGENHDGSELTDTLLIASYHHNFNTLSMLSIPSQYILQIAVHL